MMVHLSARHATRWLLALFVISTGLTAGTTARAEPSEREVEQFKHYVATGSKHYRNGEFERALEAFRKAREIANPPSLRYNVARTLQSLGRCRDAKNELESFLSVEDLSDAKRRKGKQHLEELRDQCPSRGTLAVECGPSGAVATVELDDRSQSCPADFELDPGAYRLTVTAPGYHSQTDRVEVSAGETVEHEVTLTEKAGSADNRSGGDGSTGRLIAQISGLAVGAGLLGGGVASDLGAKSRLQNMRDASNDGNAEEVQRLQEEADAARTRTIALYSAGAALTLGSAIWMTIDLTAESRLDRGVALELGISPGSITGMLRW